MGNKGSSPPPAPDPIATAGAQTGSNIQTAIANSIMGNADQYGPNGNTVSQQTGSYTITGPDGATYNVPKFTQTTTLSTKQQQLADQQADLSGDLNRLASGQTQRLGSILGVPVDLSGLPQGGTLPTSTPGLSQIGAGGRIQTAIGDAGKIQNSIGPTDYSADRQRVEDAMYARLNPQLDRDRAALETQLVNQGFQRGSDAFNQQMDQFGRQANDQRTQVVLAGGQEQSRLADLALQSGNFANAAQAQRYGQLSNNAAFGNQAQQQGFDQGQTVAGFNNAVGQQGFSNRMQLAQAMDTARERALQESLVPRNQAVSEVSSLMGNGQPQMPQFTPYQSGQVGNTDVMGAVYNSAALNNQNYQTQQQANNSFMGGLFGLGSAGILGAASKGLLFSDRRLKSGIVDLGVRLVNGAKLYAYRYLWDAARRVGVMADEVEALMPGAVHNINGFKAVDYDMVLRAA